ncbi:protein FAM151A [Scleropages formosus]|uniref:protein FAM151A n=1 Tax=Scleropages formosus TaxID=113540 RepID=UPI0010FA841E|nr:protein FAM151A [Scleropages formosus]
MLDYLIQNGNIEEKDGLQVTWYHSANNKSEMEQALKSAAMVLEADVNVEGHNTINETNIPIMAHPPNIYSDNTLQQWLDSVLKTKKGIKLDFKSIQSVEPSLEILRIRNQSGINRPVWLNADILHGPNVPPFWPLVNGTRFLELIQTKFPEATISPGWKVQYFAFTPNATYSRAMVEEMYEIIRDVPQRVTFPVLAVMVKRAWPHFSWLLSQSPRFSLTLWQGKENPTVNDLLFVRDNTHPQRVYYDIYEPVLSHFKEAARLSHRPKQFYPGGDLIEYFKPVDNDGFFIQWELITNKTSLLSVLRESTGGMLVIPVGSKDGQPGVLMVENSDSDITLQQCIDLIFTSSKPWGLYFQIKDHNLLPSTLQLLSQAYDSDILHNPTWINMELSHGAFKTPGYIGGQEFLDTINQIFPYVTLAPGWPQEVLHNGYTKPLIDDMVQLFQNTWQNVSLQVLVEHMQSFQGQEALLRAMPRFSITVQRPENANYYDGILNLFIRQGDNRRSFYNMPRDYRARIENFLT